MDEVLLITGSSGIAAAVARMWAAEDPVFVLGVNENECRSLAEELDDAGLRGREMCAMKLQSEACISECLDRFGKIDALLNVAGISARSLGDGPLHQCTSEALGRGDGCECQRHISDVPRSAGVVDEESTKRE